MINQQQPLKAQRGIVMMSSLLLLLVVTIIALSMFRSFGMQEKIAGNLREKQRALSAAVSAQQYAEYWLTLGSNAATPAAVCSTLMHANLGEGQICSNKLPLVIADVTAVPWQIAGADVGVDYLPTPNMLVSATTTGSTAANPTYFATPRFYISDMGASADPAIPGEIYQVDAVGYGGTQNTAAVVESTYAVYVASSNRTL